MSSVIPSQKQCEKKLREISALKQKPKNNTEELEKIQKEEYYKNIIKHHYRKVLSVIPDDVQQHIWGFVDVNTKLNFLRTIYTQEFINTKLSSLENNRINIKKLFSCLEYVKPIFNYYLDKDGHTYKRWGFFMEGYNKRYNVEYFMQKPPKSEKKYYINTIISLIDAGIKNYTRIYTNNKIDEVIENNLYKLRISKSSKDIRETEKDMIKLFCRIACM